MECDAEFVLYSQFFVAQKAAAPKNGIEFHQKSIGAVKSSLATSYDDWRRRSTNMNRQADRRTGKPVYWEAAPAPPKI